MVNENLFFRLPGRLARAFLSRRLRLGSEGPQRFGDLLGCFAVSPLVPVPVVLEMVTQRIAPLLEGGAEIHDGEPAVFR